MLRKLLALALFAIAVPVCAQGPFYPVIATGVVKGTTLPAKCGIGQIFFKTNVTAGANLYGCTSTNTWTALGSGGGSSAPASVVFTVCASAGCVVNETSNWTNFVTAAGTLSKCGIIATTAPTGSAIIIDLLKNGSSVFGANPKPTVTLNSTTYAAVTTFGTTAVAEGDALVAKVTQADSNSVGQFVTLKCAF